MTAAAAQADLVVSLSRPWPARGSDDGPGVLAVAHPEHAPEAELLAARSEIAALQSRLDEARRASRDTLAIIRSIARRTGVGARSAADYADHLDGRITALARVQTALARHPEMGVDLALLAGDTLMAAGAHETREFTLDGPEVLLRGKHAETLGLALHELTTNAVKFGALSRRGGRIAIDWRVDRSDPARPVLALHWTETGAALTNGAGPPGFGSELFERSMNYEMDADVRWRLGPEGLVWNMRAPLPEAGGEAGGA
ncbi:HWE histidine kinase domain-containing protein [Amaricoccus solimangrovi]|uniref:HWE histidine kinase domain-containing protein n=1 Tax=Amaricoccus solimangrovi TaxID=2589815 RepID=UPI0015E2BAF3|nr:sensor histidine kinase [Amaricoccus solimangrovi]